MIPGFDRLTDSETDLMFKAPFLACILIAGADGHIDRKEMKSAIGYATGKQQNTPSGIVNYYREIAEDFEDKLKIIFQSLPAKTVDRHPVIEGELSRLNSILPKLDKPFAAAFYKSMLEIAAGIAHSSGGLLGMNKVGSEEARYLTLPMIHDPS